MKKEDNKQQTPDNDGKLVTVAIHTYDKAVILKSILESEGIPTVIHSINLIQPVVPENVRIRINESDLPRALEIIEQTDFDSESKDSPEVKDEIVVPVDFSEYSLIACEFGFRLARDTQSSVKLMHVFFTPFYLGSVPFGDSFSLHSTDPNIYRDTRQKTEAEMKKLIGKIDEKITSGVLPNVAYTSVLVEGIAEEEIISYSKKIRPRAIVMGTQGKNAKEFDLIGSVTAEVFEGSKVPVFAVPEKAANRDLAKMKHILFLTNFRERELKAFEIMAEFLKSYSVKVYLAHITKKEDVWDEIKLSGIQKHLSGLYPHMEIAYKLIDPSDDLEESIETFVKDEQIDLISLSSSRRNIFAKMFNPGIARRMLFHSDTPLLVIKGL